MDKDRKLTFAEKLPIKISLISVKFQNSFNRLSEKIIKDKDLKKENTAKEK